MRALTKKNLLILASIIAAFAVVQVLVNVGILNSFYQITIATICINIILAVSLNLVTGFTGQFSLGHAGFMSIGAYVCALIMMRMPTTVGFLIGLIAGAFAAAFGLRGTTWPSPLLAWRKSSGCCSSIWKSPTAPLVSTAFPVLPTGCGSISLW
jgi:ABC-type branched-subunit amino acid transport system permease subunit